ncbi:oligosaccharide flippase family protein [Balneola vulgaris]|jgi:O-antigen/teichoic acid export membrane protein|uniref:oligosaccharide flippase family protein n=1 Tax=Balneola vulgaris TaxID=287535 RepID=UPI00037796AA|nr:oligosaccharide flippase family protein [Balneola vulgaris]
MSAKSLTQKTMVVVFSRVLTSLIDLTTAVIIIRILSKTEYAIVGYLLMIYEVARYVSTLGFPESIFYYFEHLSKNFRKAFALQTCGILLVTGLISGALIMLIKVLAPWLISDQFEPQVIETIQQFLPYIAIIAIFEIPSWPVHNILLASDRQKEAGWYQVITSLMSFVALIGPFALGYGIEWALYGMILYAIIRFVGSLIWMLVILPPGELKTPKGNFKEQIGFSLPLGISSFVNQFNKYADKFIVTLFLSEIAYAEYLAGATEVPIIRVIPFAVGTVLISRYVSHKIKNEHENLINVWHKGIKKVAIIVIPLTIMIVVTASSFISLLFETDGKSYQGSVLPFQLYNLIILIRVAHYGSILQAYGDTKGVLRLSISLMVLNVLLSVPFTIWFGINGTAAATLIANVINWVFTLQRIAGHMKVPIQKVLPVKHYSAVLITSSVVGVIVYLLGNLGWPDVDAKLDLTYNVVSYIGLYLVLGSLFKVITREEWRNLKEMLSFSFLWK